jgi:hypothetical protein
MALTGCCVRPATRRTNAAFFDFVLGGLEDLDLHGLAAQGALELADALLGGSQGAGRHHRLVRPDGGLAPLGDQVLPALDQRARDTQLATERRGGQFPAQHAADLFTLELRGLDPPAVGLAGRSFHGTTVL